MKPESLLELPADQNCGPSDGEPNDSQLQEVVVKDNEGETTSHNLPPDEEKIESSDAQDDEDAENLEETENVYDDDDNDDAANENDANANDDDDYEDPYQPKEQDHSELIEHATAAALKDAIEMKRSDSVLSEESSEDELEEERTIPHDCRVSNASARYMEEASYEASLVGPNHHHLAPSGGRGQQHTESTTDIVNVAMSVGSLDGMLEDTKLADSEEGEGVDKGFGTERRRSVRGIFQEFENKDGDDSPPLATIHSMPSYDTDSGIVPSDDISNVLEACGLVKPSELSSHADDVVLLHAIFQDFCQPPLDIESVGRVLEMERGLDHRAIALPMDVMIHKPSEVLVKLLGPPIFRVPKEFALGLFRILLRLLTGDNDAEYNREMLTSCSWYNDAFTSEPMDLRTTLPRQRTNSTSSLKRQNSFSDKSFNRGNAARKAGQMYNMVRLQRNWSGAVGQVCSLLDTLLENDKHDYLLAPVTRFLGLLCSGGVSVDALRHMLFLANEGTPNPKARLLLVRALKVATEGASRSSVLIGKASPRSFFSFGYCQGLRRTISLEKSPWPFRNDFGMALWFRAEHFSESSVLLRAENESGSGIEVSLLPLDSMSTSATTPTVLAVSTLSEGKPSQFIMVRSCLLLPRVWYHVAIRHTRSRLKGVFSLASREQVSIMLDGKTMVTEPLKFPKIKESSTSELTLTLAKKFDGQTGALYVFHDNVSDATFRALYEVTAGTSGVVQKRASAHDEWDSRRGDIAKKSKKLDLNMRRDDVENIVLIQKTTAKEASSAVVDLENGDESYDNNPLSKAAFNSRVYVVWDPRRTEGDMALELHSGAHVRMESENVRPWLVEGAQDVISSIGGVQALLPVFRALLSGDIEKSWGNSASNVIESSLYNNSVLCSLVPDLFSLLASFLREHNENAREMLRCGGIDIIEQLLQQNKKLGEGSLRPPSGSLVSSLSVFSSLSNLLMDSLLELRSACSHYVGLETKVFTLLLFNLPLWFGGLGPGVALYPTLLPVLSSVTRSNPEKVRDCVGPKDMIQLLKEVIESENKVSFERSHALFERETKKWEELNKSLTVFECRHVVDVVLGMLFQVLGLGATQEGLSQFLHLISCYLEAEWEQASKEVSAGLQAANRSGVREERYIFTVKASTILLLLLQTRPPIPNLYESFAASCGGIQGGAAWLLSALVNSHCDQIRSIGVRCVVSYIERTSRSLDSPLSLDRPITSDLEKSKGSGMDARTLQANTLSLISNVGQGALISNVARGLAAIGPSVRSALLTPSKLTPRVVYKLLWHLLKSHRYRMRDRTQSSLIRMVFEDTAASPSPLPSYEFLRDHFIKVDDIFGNGVSIDMGWIDGILSETEFDPEKSIQDSLAIGTLMRLLRFLPSEFTDQWLSHLLQFVSTDLSAVDTLSTCPDWQSCLFQFISETIEQSTSSIASHLQLPNGDKIEPGARHVAGDLSPLLSTDPENGTRSIDQGQPVSTSSQNDLAVLNGRLDKSLDLYAALLGHCIREGGDQALRAVEDAASLQRVCLNGNETFTLILSRLLSNLSTYGAIPIGEPSVLPSTGEPEEPSDLLKRSARLVTEAILSNGTDGLNMAAAVGCWRCLRHLTALAVAVVTKSGFGVADLFDYRNQSASAIDNISGGLHGIRLPEDGIAAIRAEDLISYHEGLGSQGYIYTEEEDESISTLRERIIFRRMCVTIAAQLLSLLDVFVFPDSLDASLPASQLHGLALVRSTETRIGTAQGPLLASGIRLSLLLLCQLEPCSVKFLQCSSRLRCFLHWSLELVRESEALEGYSSAFNVLTAPTDRLILAVVLQCHRALGRCGALLTEIESSSVDKYFDSKDSQKKYYRRLLRVVLELRDIILTSYKGRNEVLRTSLSPESFEALQSCLEVPSLSTEEPASSSPGKAASPKETMVRTLLSSSWITRFQDVDIRDGIAIPEQLELGNKIEQLDSTSCGALAVKELVTESSAIVDNFEKALNSCFEKYLEAQRIWSETGAVRDLEFEGDTTLKRLSGRHRFDLTEFGKQLALRSTAADIRWKGIDRKIVDIWEKGLHWRLARYTDRLGRRILLVRHRQFVDRQQASYELLMGKEREKEERDREERFRKKQELAELMKRNTDAFVPYGGAENPLDIEDDERDQGETGIESELENGDYTESETETTFDESLADGLDEKKADHDESKTKDDIDAWARTFIWSDNESVVARFESVMVVTLQYFVEGKLLLTTHGLYFHQIGNEVTMMTGETAEKSDVNQQLGLEANDRRWRLSRVTEVLGRRYMLRAQALELFFSDSHELFLNFPGGTKERDRFYAKLRNSCKVPMLFSPKTLHPRTAFKKSKLTELWKKRKISNFEYLMALNKMAGRTFNDIAQYPVFPWILSDYTSETIDLTDSRVYRDLTKPVGALNPDRLAQLIERYNELEEFGFSASEKFLFGSHYSAPGVILHYLIRQEPFTSMAIDLQSGRFDCPDRLFFDLAESWKSCNTSSSDVKELIPEFFTLPEMLLNTNKFPLGHTQRGRLVDNVGLPPWAKGSAYEFVRIHRLALESEYVSHNLNHWIDLVFGYQQRGPEAEAAHNVFHHLSYEGSVDLDKIPDELDRQAAESHIQNFGQTPSQLLVKEPHPNRCAAEECWKPLIHSVKAAQTLRCYTPSKQFGGKKAGPGAALKIHVQADSILVIYSDLSVGTYKWTPKNVSNKLKPEKLRPLPNREVSNSRSVIKRGSAAPQTMDDSSSSSLAIGNWSFAFTLGGYEKEQQRRKAVMPSRLASAKDALYTEASALAVSCGYWDNTVKVHSMDAWRLECSETGGHRGPIRCLGIGQDGGLLVTGGQDSTCRVWVVDHPDMALALADGYVQTAIGQSNDGEQVLSCCHVLWGHETPITCLDLSSDLDVTVSGSMGGLVCVHTLRRGEFVRSITPPSDTKSPVARLALDSHGRMAVHMGDMGLHTYTINGVRLCSVDAGERLHDMKITGETLVTGGDSCHVYIRNITNLKILSMLDLSRHGPIRCISLTPCALNPTPQFLFIGSDDGMITIVDKEEEKKTPK